MKNLKVWSAMALIFFSGAVIGVAVSTFVIKKHVMGFMEGGPPRANRRIVMEVTRDIDLSDLQRARIDSIMNDNNSRIETIAGEFRETMDQFFESQTSQIMALLTEEQQREFDRRYSEIRKTIEKRIHRHSPAHRPGDRKIRKRHHPRQPSDSI